MYLSKRLKVLGVGALIVVPLSVYALDGIAVSSRKDRGGNIGLIRTEIRSDDTISTRILWPGKTHYPAINVEGTKVAFFRDDNGTDRLSVMDLDGGDVTDLATVSRLDQASVHWPEGEYLYFFCGSMANGPVGAKRVSINKPGQVESTNVPAGWHWGLSADATRAHSAWSSSTHPMEKQADGSWKEVKGGGGCGAAISPSGTMMCFHTDPSHTCTGLQRWGGEGAGCAEGYADVVTNSPFKEVCYGGNSVLTFGLGGWEPRWAANSDHWVLLGIGWPHPGRSGGCGFNQVLVSLKDRKAVMGSVNGRSCGADDACNGGDYPWAYNEAGSFWVTAPLEDVIESMRTHVQSRYITLNPSQLQFTADEGGAAPAAQTVSISYESSIALPALSALHDADWLTATISGQGAEQSISVKADPSGLVSGLYTERVTIRGAIADAFLNVVLRINGTPAPRSVVITPPQTVLQQKATQQFSAKVFDQFGEALSNGVKWSAAGGTVSSGGLFTAANDTGQFAVTATVSDAASVSASADIIVTSGALMPPGLIKSMITLAFPDGRDFHHWDVYKDWNSYIEGYYNPAIEKHPQPSDGARVPWPFENGGECVWHSETRDDGRWGDYDQRDIWFYNAITVINPTPRRIMIGYQGQFDRCTAWINGKSVLGAGATPDAEKFSPLRDLPFGPTTFLFKTSGGWMGRWIQWRFVDENGEDISDLYFDFSGDVTPVADAYRIHPSGQIQCAGHLFKVSSTETGRLILSTARAKPYSIKIYQANGACIASFEGTGPARLCAPAMAAKGIRLIRARIGNSQVEKRVVVR